MIEFGHLTHPGLRRDLNEDTYYGDGELALWLVADGMGGHACGEVASALARETIVREIRRGATLAHAIRIADEEIIRTSRRRNDSLPMGTTVVAARVQGNRYEVAWVGDSRAYLWRDGKLAQLSQDHSVVQELVAQGNLTAEQARAHPRLRRCQCAGMRGYPGRRRAGWRRLGQHHRDPGAVPLRQASRPTFGIYRWGCALRR